jgi:hypothetical protein
MPTLKYFDVATQAYIEVVGRAGVGVPPGGAPGDVMKKTGTADYETGWGSPEVPPGGAVEQVLTKLSNSDGDVGWRTRSKQNVHVEQGHITVTLDGTGKAWVNYSRPFTFPVSPMVTNSTWGGGGQCAIFGVGTWEVGRFQILVYAADTRHANWINAGVTVSYLAVEVETLP